ncbi:acyltransferase [Pedobacter sp. KR3-3]|uniref:Acyltransferase n=1 Tax=Pedobacter albus TaxID=3113905 RepID=A0ABU7I705_9SPHI|nr:acyltransferase [Pedobacter sp. KR3-3]MEE1945142.1 acyltransferase [Pedobacter sp. KR3-3]
MSTKQPDTKLLSIDILRGIAALAVCFFHLTGSTGLSKNTVALGKYGFLGVEVFFVISGFIIPYSMYKAKYQFSLFGRFLAKRLLRIHPPYLATLLMTILLIYLVRRPYMPSWPSMISHVFYLDQLFHYESISPVFWTLVIEIQFYIFIGLCFFIINNKSTALFVGFIQILLLIFYLNNWGNLFGWIGLFVLGMILFRFKYLQLPKFVFWTLIFQCALLIGYKIGIAESIAGILAVLYINYISIRSNDKAWVKPLLFLGTISYSLYLIHWELGRTVVAIVRHIPVLGGFELFRVLIGVLSSILLAFIGYRLIEKPAIQLSKTIPLKTK